MRDSLKFLLVFTVAAVLGQGQRGRQDSEDSEGGDEEEVECPEYVCPEQHGSFADPCECRRFYKCNHGVPTRLLCPSSLYFDDVLKYCTYKNEAQCGPVEKKKKVEEDPATRAPRCPRDPDVCQLANYCYCSRKGDLAPKKNFDDLPHFVLLMIDGAVNSNNFKYYDDLFQNYDNKSIVESSPPLKATFFIEHEYCDYYFVEKLFVDGHEIALSSVTGKILQHENSTVWENEIVSLRSILMNYANIPEDDILGFRAPKLHPGFNEQFEAMLRQGIVWDSSVATKPIKAPVWPYTLDYRIPHECKIDSCPTRAYPGLWEIPLNSHYNNEASGGQCTYLDECVFTYQSPESILQWLKEDFLRYHTTNKAPYTLPIHTNWFLYEEQFKALKQFISWSKDLPGVHYVTVTDYLLWMTDPTAHDAPKEAFKPLEPENNRRLSCSSPNTCELSKVSQELSHLEKNDANGIRYMRTCEDCPREKKYPWLLPLGALEDYDN